MSQEIAIIATNARPTGPNMTYVREETITVSEPLTDTRPHLMPNASTTSASSKRRRRSPKPPQNTTATARKNGRFTVIS